MKSFLQTIIIIICVAAGLYGGHWAAQNLTSWGVTFVTLTDLAGCYFTGLFAGVLVGRIILILLNIDYE